MTKLRFMKFIMDEIFPGGDLPQAKGVVDHAERAGFGVKLVQPLRLHYARTLDTWSAALRRAGTRPSPCSPKRCTTGT